jgi:hypothetical protein
MLYEYSILPFMEYIIMKPLDHGKYHARWCFLIDNEQLRDSVLWPLLRFVGTAQAYNVV